MLQDNRQPCPKIEEKQRGIEDAFDFPLQGLRGFIGLIGTMNHQAAAGRKLFHPVHRIGNPRPCQIAEIDKQEIQAAGPDIGQGLVKRCMVMQIRQALVQRFDMGIDLLRGGP